MSWLWRLLDVHELSVAESVDDPDLGALADRPLAGLGQGRDLLPGLDDDGLGGLGPQALAGDRVREVKRGERG